MTQWLNVIITAIYTLATIFICKANIDSAKAAKDAVEETKKEFKNSREMENRIRQKKQAVQIACWETSEECDLEIPESEDSEFVFVHIANSSSEPVYEAVLSFDLVNYDMSTILQTGSDNCKYLHCIPPGDYVTVLPWRGPGMHMKFGPSITFRDAAGLYWHRDANGILRRISKESVRFRKLDLPVDNNDFSISRMAFTSRNRQEL